MMPSSQEVGLGAFLASPEEGSFQLKSRRCKKKVDITKKGALLSGMAVKEKNHDLFENSNPSRRLCSFRSRT